MPVQILTDIVTMKLFSGKEKDVPMWRRYRANSALTQDVSPITYGHYIKIYAG
jgi:hypothetical protein